MTLAQSLLEELDDIYEFEPVTTALALGAGATALGALAHHSDLRSRALKRSGYHQVKKDLRRERQARKAGSSRPERRALRKAHRATLRAHKRNVYRQSHL